MAVGQPVPRSCNVGFGTFRPDAMTVGHCSSSLFPLRPKPVLTVRSRHFRLYVGVASLVGKASREGHRAEWALDEKPMFRLASVSEDLFPLVGLVDDHL